MRSVSIVSSERNNRNMSATLAQHCKKREFPNSFVSLMLQRNNRNMVKRVCVSLKTLL